MLERARVTRDSQVGEFLRQLRGLGLRGGTMVRVDLPNIMVHAFSGVPEIRFCFMGQMTVTDSMKSGWGWRVSKWLTMLFPGRVVVEGIRFRSGTRCDVIGAIISIGWWRMVISGDHLTEVIPAHQRNRLFTTEPSAIAAEPELHVIPEGLAPAEPSADRIPAEV